jgi:protein KRI1
LASKSKLLPRTLSRGEGSKKKVTLGEYQRTRIQELMKTSDDPARALADATMIQRRDDGAFQEEDEDNKRILPHNEEQEQLRREVTNAFHTSAGDAEDDFFTKKERSTSKDFNDELEDPENYKKFLLGVLGGKDQEEAVREILRSQTEEAAAGDVPEPARGKAPKVRVEDNTEQENEEFLMK